MHALFGKKVQSVLSGNQSQGGDRRELTDVVQRVARKLVCERLADAVDLIVVLAIGEGMQLGQQVWQERCGLREMHHPSFGGSFSKNART
jgi:hypothetical protein